MNVLPIKVNYPILPNYHLTILIEVLFTYTSLDKEPELKHDYDNIAHSVWPEYIFHDVYTIKYWTRIEKYFPSYQLLFKYGTEVVGFANSVPIHWERPLQELPQKGWDWLMEKSIQDFENKLTPNLLAGLNISLRKEFQGRGWSYQIIKTLKENGKTLGFSQVVFPVRPSKKYLFPEMPIQEYILKKNPTKQVFDPWLRTHIRAGGNILHICHEAMLIQGTLQEWEKWCGKTLQFDNQVIIPGGLVPVHFKPNDSIGTYLEPNVWVVHELLERREL